MDWISLAMGAGLGITAGGLFFGALALNVRAACRARQPGALLLAMCFVFCVLCFVFCVSCFVFCLCPSSFVFCCLCLCLL